MDIPLPDFEPRLQRRYQQLVQEHLHTSEGQAAGGRALPSVHEAFASTQAAWRYYANEAVTLPGLAAPLLAQARQMLPTTCRRYGLVAHDWSALRYPTHDSKLDRRLLGKDLGYELATALLLSDQTGAPLVPVSLGLRASDGWHTTQEEKRSDTDLAPLDLTSQIMASLRAQQWTLPLVHIIDRGGDSVGHYRQWQAAKELFLVRAKDDQRVIWDSRTHLLREVVTQVPVRPAQAVEVAAQVMGQLLVGQTEVVLDRPAFPRARTGKRRWVPGEALTLRLIVCQVRLPDEALLAEWYLLSNLPAEVTIEQLAEWYYFRWRIESYFKLLKSHGFQIEQWKQTCAAALTKRLLVTAMACVVVWQLQQATEPEQIAMRELLIRLSGRQVRRGYATAPALLAGLWVFLSSLELLEHYDLADLKRMARLTVPGYS